MTMDPESRIKELGLELPPSVPPGGVYKPIVITGNLGYISGHGPYLGDDKYITCLLYTSPSPRDQRGSRMPSSA